MSSGNHQAEIQYGKPRTTRCSESIQFTPSVLRASNFLFNIMGNDRESKKQNSFVAFEDRLL